MKAVVVREHGAVDQLQMEQRAIPQPAAAEALVEVKACGINHLDLWVRQGVPGHTFNLPLVPGSDITGVVQMVGETIPPVQVGDAVMISPGISCGHCQACLLGRDNRCRHYGIIGESRDGGYADYVVVPAANLIPKPENLSFEEAAAVPLVFETAWHMLVTRAQIRPGEEVLVHAAGSGVGSAAIQIAKLWGARVIATAGSDRKLERAQALGADYTINYQKQNFAAEVRRLTSKRGVDIVFEHVGATTWEGSMRSLARGGRIVICGATSGAEVTVNLRAVFFKHLSILGSTMGSKGELLEAVKFVRNGQLKPVLDRTFSLQEVRQAHQYMMNRQQFGKIVLVP